MTDTKAFALGISAEEKLAMPLDDLIRTAKKSHGPGKKSAGLGKAKFTTKPVRKQLSVKKTVTVPIAKTMRARATQIASSAKRQAVLNKRRAGLAPATVDAGKKVRGGVTVQLRSRPTSALRAGNKRVPKRFEKSGGLDVSNIQRHFRTHPVKFDLPKGTNLRITINLNNVKPVVGTKK